MLNNLFIAGLLQIVLMAFATVLLIQPEALLLGKKTGRNYLLKWMRMFVFCMTFLWSIYFGMLLAANDWMLH